MNGKRYLKKQSGCSNFFSLFPVFPVISAVPLYCPYPKAALKGHRARGHCVETLLLCRKQHGKHNRTLLLQFSQKFRTDLIIISFSFLES
jgi:hypothetical protein